MRLEDWLKYVEDVEKGQPPVSPDEEGEAAEEPEAPTARTAPTRDIFDVKRADRMEPAASASPPPGISTEEVVARPVPPASEQQPASSHKPAEPAAAAPAEPQGSLPLADSDVKIPEIEDFLPFLREDSGQQKPAARPPEPGQPEPGQPGPRPAEDRKPAAPPTTRPASAPPAAARPVPPAPTGTDSAAVRPKVAEPETKPADAPPPAAPSAQPAQPAKNNGQTTFASTVRPEQLRPRMEPPAPRISAPSAAPPSRAVQPEKPSAGKPEAVNLPAEPAPSREPEVASSPASAVPGDTGAPGSQVEQTSAEWNRLPKHLQAFASMKAEEIAQRSYKRDFRESREELLARLLDPPLSLEDAARILNVCPTTVRRYTNRGVLPHFRTAGNQRRFRFSDLVAFMEAQASRTGRPRESESDAE